MLMRLITSLLYLCSFFFSSRRRHTRLQGDWSSDVCSSDLTARPNCTTSAQRSRNSPSSHRSRQQHFERPERMEVWLLSLLLLLAGIGGGVWGGSGEGRGGEEGRSRWAPDHLKKKKRDRERC